MTETLEKETQTIKPCENFENKLYEEINRVIKNEATEDINKLIEKIPEEGNIDALSRVLNDYINEKATTDEEQKKLLHCMAFAIIAYVTREQITEIIDEEMSKMQFTKAIFNKVDIEKHIGVRAKKGDKSGVAIIPNEVIKGKTDAEIIEFAKEMPNFTQNSDLIDAEFEILRGEELKNEFLKAKDLVNKNKIGKVMEIEEENEKCQN